MTVLGRDSKGIIAKVSHVLCENDINILDLTQTVFGDMFNMVMLVDVSAPGLDFSELRARLRALGEEIGQQIRIQRSEIFDAMYRV